MNKRTQIRKLGTATIFSKWKINSRCPQFFLLLLLICLASGCNNKPKYKTLDEAGLKFVELCKSDGHDVVLKPLENTLWIYVPTPKKLFGVRASGYGIKKSSEGKYANVVKYADVVFEDSSFHITYDISEQTQYPNDLGYGFLAEEYFTSLYQGIFNNIARVYLEVETIPGERPHPDPAQDKRDKKLAESYVKRAKVPEFFVVVFADIVNGIEAQVIFNFTDFKKERAQALAMGESQLRRVSRYSGNLNIIGDKLGEYLDVHEITWPEFLSGQVLARITAAYANNPTPDELEPEKAILDSAAKTIKIYDFKNFESVILENLNSDQQQEFARSIFDDYDITDPEPQGTIHTLKFDTSGNITEDIVN